jgi:putative colanic acid biosynthesis acetyltransferase WcaF
MPIDTRAHLRNHNYPPATQLKRVAWGIAQPLFRLSPNALHGWRNLLLRLLGARVAVGVRIHPSARIMFPWNLQIGEHVIVGRDANLYALAPITLDASVLVSQGVHLCAGSHDYRQPNFPIAHAPIRVESGTWIAAEAFVGPGVTIGAGSVVAARAVVVRDVAPGSLVAGNPARVIKNLSVPQ